MTRHELGPGGRRAAGDHVKRRRSCALMERWNDEVMATVPAERLLVWEPAEGLEPLCEFLEVECRRSRCRG